MMDRTRFEFVYIHANSLAELALQQRIEASLAAEPLDATGSTEPTEPTDQEDVLARLSALQNADLDWSIFDALSLPDPAAATRTAANPAGAGAGDVAGDGSSAGAMDGAAAGASTARLAGQDDLREADPVAAYLGRAYASRPQIRTRLDRLFGALDRDRFAGLLAGLPGDHAPLDAALSPAEFRDWLDTHRSGQPALSALVLAVRRLDVAD